MINWDRKIFYSDCGQYRVMFVEGESESWLADVIQHGRISNKIIGYAYTSEKAKELCEKHKNEQ